MDRREIVERFGVDTASVIDLERIVRRVRVVADGGAERVYRGIDRWTINSLSAILAAGGWTLDIGRVCLERWRRP